MPAILVVWAATVPAQAMTVVQRDFPELVARAEQIVVGTVTGIRETEEAPGEPVTLVTFSDLTVLKGDVGPELTLRLAGGRTGAYAVQVSDMPRFTLGERAVLFVAGNGRDICPLVGAWQGRFRVRFDAALGTEIVENNGGAPVVGLVRRNLQFSSPAATGGGASPMTLDAFRQLVADEMAAPQGAAQPQ
jgi:hypothetical protein